MKKIILILLVVITILTIIFVPRMRNQSNSEEPASKPGGGGAGGGGLAVEVVVIEAETRNGVITASGNIIPSEQVMLRSEASGRITQLNLTEGSFVRKGSLLLKINDNELQAQLKRIEAETELAAQREKRMKSLLDIDGVSREAYDEVYNRLKILEAELMLIKAQIEKTEIRAPFDGFTGLRQVSPGGYVTNNTEIASFVRTNPVKIDFSLPERYAYQVSAGDSIKFRVDGYDKDFYGDIYAIEPLVNISTRSFNVRALSRENLEDFKLIPGSFARIEIIMDQDNDVIMVPTHALVPDMDKNKVFIVKNGVAEEREVGTGRRYAGYMVINSGLNSGDTIITTGILQLRPGMPVRITSIK